MNELKRYEEELEESPNIEIIEDRFESIIFDNDDYYKILYSLDLMPIDENENLYKIYVYTEVNTYDSGEVFAHALGFLTKAEAKQEMISEIDNRSNKDSENYYWISDGDIEDEHVELKDEEGSISYLE